MEAAPRTGIQRACEALGIRRATFYRRRQARPLALRLRKPGAPHALSATEKEQVLSHLQSPRFLDRSVRQVYAALLDAGEYLCSISTMYRLLRAENQVRERCKQSRHRKHKKPVLKASAPNQVWTWDITRLRGPHKGSGYRLYVILDLFSRYVVGWLLAERECQHLAAQLIEATAERQGVSREP
jgi:putative transposase